MASENIFIAHPENAEQVNALKAFVKALKIKFEIPNERPYNEDFINKIKKSREEIKEGNFKKINKEDLQNFLGL